MKLPFSH